MEIPELPDYVLYFKPQDSFLRWGEIGKRDDGQPKYGWGAVKEDAYASIFTKEEAENHSKTIETKHGWVTEIRLRKKTEITVTLI